MEANLTRLESKLDALLAQFEADAGASVLSEDTSDSSAKTQEQKTETSEDQGKADKKMIITIETASYFT
ncbi:hypothetical protein G7054_g11049 [Neopestalotiopsis clavispora]|nr:hypothetical protein G7054_g11049 [Neopestalotiopsis clavispora]